MAVLNTIPSADALELQVFQHAYQCKVPILGICRGAQLIMLHWVVISIRIFVHYAAKPKQKHNISGKLAVLEHATKINDIIGQETIQINSLHNQAINYIADPLQQSAIDMDDFVQAVEHRHHDFIIGVQWHPEYMPYARAQRKLFAAFSAAVKASNKTLPASMQH